MLDVDFDCRTVCTNCWLRHSNKGGSNCERLVLPLLLLSQTLFRTLLILYAPLNHIQADATAIRQSSLRALLALDLPKLDKCEECVSYRRNAYIWKYQFSLISEHVSQTPHYFVSCFGKLD